MKEKILSILNESSFSEKLIRYVKDEFPSNYKKLFNKPYHKAYSKNPILGLEIPERVNESLAQLIDLKEFYKNKEIPLTYLYESLYDLSYRLERYQKNYGVFGLSDWDLKWLSSLYKAEIFNLGSLRFQISYFSNKEIERSDYQYMPLEEKWKKRFPEGTPIITIHILENTDFSPNKIDKSFNLARDFFEKYFIDHKYEIFICRTWLLYEPTRDILDKNSNIAAFSKRFQIIAENKNTKQALDRIYGTSDMSAINKMDKNTSLEKIAYKKLDKLGVAAGIIYK
ncbi:MAG: hypothetical protein GX752_02465 [Clostridium sp.]|nr:hypothetical protein [Clostridium sp.]